MSNSFAIAFSFPNELRCDILRYDKLRESAAIVACFSFRLSLYHTPNSWFVSASHSHRSKEFNSHLMSRALIIPSSSATGCHSQMDGSNQGCHSQMDESNQGFQFHYEQYILIQEKVFNFIMNDTY